MEDIDSAWSNFCEDDILDTLPVPMPTLNEDALPKCSPLNISTKTKIAYLNSPIDLKAVFWNIPIIPYYTPVVGVVKKQMKFNSVTPEEVAGIVGQKAAYEYVDDFIISQINNPDGRTKFKDIRKS